MSENKCYSRNGEEFNYLELGDMLRDMGGDGELHEGAEYWEAEANHPKTSEFFDANRIIEDAAEQAYGEVGEYAEGYGDVPEEAIAELQELLDQWADKHCTVTFWTVSNAKKMTVTAEQVADYKDGA